MHYTLRGAGEVSFRAVQGSSHTTATGTLLPYLLGAQPAPCCDVLMHRRSPVSADAAIQRRRHDGRIRVLRRVSLLRRRRGPCRSVVLPRRRGGRGRPAAVAWRRRRAVGRRRQPAAAMQLFERTIANMATHSCTTVERTITRMELDSTTTCQQAVRLEDMQSHTMNCS